MNYRTVPVPLVRHRQRAGNHHLPETWSACHGTSLYPPVPGATIGLPRGRPTRPPGPGIAGTVASPVTILSLSGTEVTAPEPYRQRNGNPIPCNIETSLSRPLIAAILPIRPTTRFVQVSRVIS
jgi:hypothetical protein